MGRVKAGELPQSVHASRNIRKHVQKNFLKNPLAPSRRNPLGYYDVLGVSVSATAEEVRRAWKRQALANHPDKGTASERSGRTRKMQRINDAYEVLRDADLRTLYDLKFAFRKPCSLSTERVRIHRQYQTKTDKHIVNAITTCRRRLKNRKGARMSNEAKARKRESRKETYRNNKFTRGWIVTRRPRSMRAKDKRLGEYEVFAKEAVW